MVCVVVYWLVFVVMVCWLVCVVILYWLVCILMAYWPVLIGFRSFHLSSPESGLKVITVRL